MSKAIKKWTGNLIPLILSRIFLFNSTILSTRPLPKFAVVSIQLLQCEKSSSTMERKRRLNTQNSNKNSSQYLTHTQSVNEGFHIYTHHVQFRHKILQLRGPSFLVLNPFSPPLATDRAHDKQRMLFYEEKMSLYTHFEVACLLTWADR